MHEGIEELDTQPILTRKIGCIGCLCEQLSVTHILICCCSKTVVAIVIIMGDKEEFQAT